MNVPSTKNIPDDSIMIHIDQIKKLHGLFPEIKFYWYYVTQVNETGWFDDYIGVETFDLYSKVKTLLPDYVKTDRLLYKSLEDYEDCHYASDHHWNHKGVKRGYEDIYGLMADDLGLSDVRIPCKEWNYSELYNFKYYGSFARRLGSMYSGCDDFCAYEYNIPDRDVFAVSPETFEEIPLLELGLFEEYSTGHFDKSQDHYIAYYGYGIPKEGNEIYREGNAIYLIKNKKTYTGHNLLIYGDSYNRALRDVLASHFDTTLYFQRDIIENYDNVYIDELIEKYNIDVVLYGGNSDIWTIDEYMFDFSSAAENSSEEDLGF